MIDSGKKTLGRWMVLLIEQKAANMNKNGRMTGRRHTTLKDRDLLEIVMRLERQPFDSNSLKMMVEVKAMQGDHHR